jgi:mannose-1-phosphate guanylyltransferase
MQTVRNPHTWAIVLAGGEGKRLHAITTTEAGVAIPKQFCSIYGGLSLLQETLRRATSFASRRRTCAVVASKQKRWWAKTLLALPKKNVIVEPSQRGTANGVLLAALTIATHDAEACVVILPADHHLSKETLLMCSVLRALSYARMHANEVLLLGMKPTVADADYGYIVPGGSNLHGVRAVQRFVEKPAALDAARLVAAGSLLNTFIIVAQVGAVIDLYRKRFLALYMTFRNATNRRLKCKDDSVIEGMYKHLLTLDFCRDILEEAPSARLRVLAVPECGWTDLGTVNRVAAASARARHHLEAKSESSHAVLNLAEQHGRRLVGANNILRLMHSLHPDHPHGFDATPTAQHIQLGKPAHVD